MGKSVVIGGFDNHCQIQETPQPHGSRKQDQGPRTKDQVPRTASPHFTLYRGSGTGNRNYIEH